MSNLRGDIFICNFIVDAVNEKTVPRIFGEVIKTGFHPFPIQNNYQNLPLPLPV